MRLNNRYKTISENLSVASAPADFSSPRVIAYNHELADELGLGGLPAGQLASFFSGQKLLPGSEPVALAYAGHQFGHFTPSLGDGRALILGDIKGFDIQLKGSGATVFSRRGDGRSALGPVIREYLISEFMHACGIPTTRALAAVGTGEMIMRQFGAEPGGVFTRVAKSHIRVGSFEYFAARSDHSTLAELANHVIVEHFQEIPGGFEGDDSLFKFVEKLTLRQVDLIAKWTGAGFVHGVMNTDNCSAIGLTIDYGPCAFLEEFSFVKVFSSIDRGGRYAFFNQTEIAKWNMVKLVQSLLPLFTADKKSVTASFNDLFEALFPRFELARYEVISKKMGVEAFEVQDKELVDSFLSLLEAEELDFTLAFRELEKWHLNADSRFFPKDKKSRDLRSKWLERQVDPSAFNTVNPLYIPRNHLVAKAIEESYQGDHSFFVELSNVLKDPFTKRTVDSLFAEPATAENLVTKTYCGT